MHDQARHNGIIGPGVVVIVRAGCSRALAPESNLGRVSSKSSNIISNPFNRKSLVKKSKVKVLLGLSKACSVGKAKDVDPIARVASDQLQCREGETFVAKYKTGPSNGQEKEDSLDGNDNMRLCPLDPITRIKTVRQEPSLVEPAAEHPDQHWQWLIRLIDGMQWAPNIESQAIL